MAYYMIYDMSVKPGMEKEFKQAWQSFSAEVRLNHSSHGAVIFKNTLGVYICISMWPSKSAWQSFWVNKEQTLQSLSSLKACLSRPTEPYPLEMIYTNLPGLEE